MSDVHKVNEALKALDDHNRDRCQQWADVSDGRARPNGIACPKCGAELFDSRPDITLTSNPPQKDTRCSACPYTGYRIA